MQRRIWGKKRWETPGALEKKEPINFPSLYASKKETAQVFFSTLKTITHILFVAAPSPHVLKIYFLSEETITHIRFKIRVSEPQRRKQLTCFSALEKRKWHKCFLYLKKPLRICFSRTRPCFLKMYFRLEKTVTHIRFKINFPDKGFRPTKMKKPLMCFSLL